MKLHNKDVYEIGKNTNIYIFGKDTKIPKKLKKKFKNCSSFDIL
jgi:hypothetical protein